MFKSFVWVGACASALSLVAAVKPIASLQVASEETLSQAAGKLGEAIGQPMVGMMLAGQIAQSPIARVLGPTRAGSSVVVPLYVDVEKSLAQTNIALNEIIDYAIVYPLAKSKDDLLNAFSDAVETNGYWHVTRPSEEMSILKDGYFKFSDDGQWFVLSPKAQFLSKGLSAIPLAKKPMDGDAVRLRVSSDGFEWLSKNLDRAIADLKSGSKNRAASDSKISTEGPMGVCTTEIDVRQAEELKFWCDGFKGACLGLALDDRGLGLRWLGAMREDHAIQAYGKNKLAPQALAFAKDNTFFASAEAAGANLSMYEKWQKMVAVAKKHGFDLSFLKEVKAENQLQLVIDVEAAQNYFSGSMTNSLAKINPESFVKDLKESVAGADSAKRFSGSLSLFAIGASNIKSSITAEQRFANALPELAPKELDSKSVVSLGLLIKALMPAYLATLDESMRTMVAPMMAQLPDAGNAGIACGAWRENNNMFMQLRIPMAEFRSISCVVNLAMAQAMMRMQSSCEAFEIDEDDEEENDDESDEGAID